jgi:hypothetical protein
MLYDIGGMLGQCSGAFECVHTNTTYILTLYALYILHTTYYIPIGGMLGQRFGAFEC